MIVVCNRIPVNPDHAAAFEARFADRANLVDGMPGFVSFQLLRPIQSDDPYIVMTFWESEAHFKGWTESAAFKEGHARSSKLPPETFRGHSRLDSTKSFKAHLALNGLTKPEPTLTTKEQAMCRQLILLARNNHQQMIFTCEHDTMHITHKQTTICLSQPEFRQFAAFVTDGSLFDLNQSEVGSVREAADQQTEVWIGSGGIRLSVDEFFLLTQLLREAVQRLDSMPRRKSVADPLPNRKPPHYHSLN